MSQEGAAGEGRELSGRVGRVGAASGAVGTLKMGGPAAERIEWAVWAASGAVGTLKRGGRAGQ